MNLLLNPQLNLSAPPGGLPESVMSHGSNVRSDGIPDVSQPREESRQLPDLVLLLRKALFWGVVVPWGVACQPLATVAGDQGRSGDYWWG